MSGCLSHVGRLMVTGRFPAGLSTSVIGVPGLESLSIPRVPQEGLVLLSRRGHIRMDVRSSHACSAGKPSAVSTASPSRYPQHLSLCRCTTCRLPMRPCSLRMRFQAHDIWSSGPSCILSPEGLEEVGCSQCNTPLPQPHGFHGRDSAGTGSHGGSDLSPPCPRPPSVPTEAHSLDKR